MPEPEIIPPSPQRRGRPRKDGTAPRGAEAFGAAEAPKPEVDGPGSGKPRSRPRKKTMAEIKAEWARQLYGGHQLAVMMTGVTALAITEQEAMVLADPFVETLEWLGIPLDGGAFPPLTLLLTAAMVYVPKLRHIDAELRARRAKPAEATVVEEPAAPPSFAYEMAEAA